MADGDLPPLRGDTYQERLARAEEREAILGELADEGIRTIERGRAVIALLIFTTLAGTLVVPVWGAILGGTWWVLRALAGAPSPW